MARPKTILGPNKTGYPNKLNDKQYNRYKKMQQAEYYPGGYDIHAGNELGFSSRGKKIAGADKADTFGATIRKQYG